MPTGDIGLDAPAATSEVPGGASSHPSAEVRKKTWISQHPDNGSVNSLEALLKARLDLARLLGYENYAQLALSDKMAQSPSSVWKFLDALNEANRSKATDDARYLASLRGFETVEPWDRDFCSMVIPAPRGPPLSPFFSVGTCVQGISRTLQRVFGISLHFAQAADEWTWDAQVRRIEVRDESGKLLGLIYMDLFEREGKGQGAAHYTVQCARKTSWDDEAGDAFYTLPEEQEAGQSSLRSNMESKKKQLPRVVLSFDFDQRRSGPTTLQWHQVETLFHEMGHAIHSNLFAL